MIRLNRRRAGVLLPIACLLLALTMTVTAGMYQNATTLDLTFGKGRRVVVTPDENRAREAEYYRQQYSTSARARNAAQEVARRISDEGVVLLKNDGLLPLAADTSVLPLGLRFAAPYYGGTGSSAISTAQGDVITPAEGLRGAFSHVIERAVDWQTKLYQQGKYSATRPADCMSPSHILYEFSEEDLLPLRKDAAGSVGLVYIGRQTGENADACTAPYEDGTPHMLALTQDERTLIDFAARSCEGVVVVLCSASAMQVPEIAADDRISAVLWVGGAGSTGYASLADILAGNVNPSGHLPVTFAQDFTKDPSFVNHDDGSSRFTYANVATTGITSTAITENAPAAFHEYEEGVYVGYRYYETACALGYLSDLGDRPEGVVWPFGHGLSYTAFTQRIVEARSEENQAGVTVEVTNVGSRSGKAVVQLYAERPYTELDRTLGIEKSAVDLLQFQKTDLLRPGETVTLTLFFPMDQMASYCSGVDNGDGTTGSYVLTEGEYRLSVRENCHVVLDAAVLSVAETRFYSGADPRPSEMEGQSAVDIVGGDASDYVGDAPKPATDRFPEMNAYALGEISGMTTLSRAAWLETQPTAPTEADRVASPEVTALIRRDDAAAPLAHSKAEKAPASGEENGVVLADLRGRAYDDPLWDVLLDQIDYTRTDALRETLFHGGYGTAALEDVSLPATVCYDGPQGLTLADVSGKNWLKDVCGYPAAPVIAATWDHDLMYDLGEAVGQEALAAGIHGWYAPGLNILRSPFCGRASEYFSEDPNLAGLLGARLLSGAGDSGLACAVKHFPVMETENHRSPNTCTWMTEQTLREIYLKPFELALKFSRKLVYYYNDEADRTMSVQSMRAGDFIMTSDSAVGSRWSAANEALLMDVVRGEWGFEGAVITDMHQAVSSSMVDALLFGGSDVLMTSSTEGVSVSDMTDPATQNHIRRAVKDLCFTFVNSSATQHMAPASRVTYHPSLWKVVLAVANLLTFLLFLAAVFLCIEWKRAPKTSRISG